MNQYDSFVLRIWRRAEAQDVVWRCKLEHLQTRETWHFSADDELLTGITAILGSSSRRIGPGTMDDTSGLALKNQGKEDAL